MHDNTGSVNVKLVCAQHVSVRCSSLNVSNSVVFIVTFVIFRYLLNKIVCMFVLTIAYIY